MSKSTPSSTARWPDTRRAREALNAINAHKAEGHHLSDSAIAHISPAHLEAINPHGTLSFDVASVLKRSRRALRSV
jgi:hypothetical protein